MDGIGRLEAITLIYKALKVDAKCSYTSHTLYYQPLPCLNSAHDIVALSGKLDGQKATHYSRQL